jgi:hypothetical protein
MEVDETITNTQKPKAKKRTVTVNSTKRSMPSKPTDSEKTQKATATTAKDSKPEIKLQEIENISQLTFPFLYPTSGADFATINP